MSKLPLTNVRYFDEHDIYDYSVDNRPLMDLRTNIEEVSEVAHASGHIGVYSANPESEPAGGFAKYTCAAIDSNNRLSAIDISLPSTVVNYSKLPIVLVIDKHADGTYTAISFAAFLELETNGYNRFLPDAIGRAIKVGPGGSLVDEVYFNVYHSGKGYQTITVGKILTVNGISFGGNQVSVLGDNRFLPKNLDDSALSLITWLRQSSVSNTSFQSFIVNDDASLYPFTQVRHSQADLSGSPSGAIPVYFTNSYITPTKSTGNFDFELDPFLNEVHYASPAFSTFTEADSKFRTAGVNYGKMLDFSRNFLLHSETYSSNINETSQKVSTELAFTSPVNHPTVVSFSRTPDDNLGIGTYIDTTTGLPDRFFTSLSFATNKQTGVVFGGYHKNTSGAFVGYRRNTVVGSPSEVEGTLQMADLTSGSSLLIHNKSADGTPAHMFLHTDGYLNLYGAKGVFYHKDATQKYEVVNLNTLTQTIKSLSNAADLKVPLAGTASDAPLTGKLYFNLKGNAVDTSLGLVFDSITKTVLQSSNPYEMRSIAGSLQIVRGASPVGNDDFATKGYVTQAITNGLTSGSEYLVTTNTAQTVTGQKTFSQQVIISNNTPVKFTGSTSQIESTSNTVEFVGALGNPVKIVTSATQTADPSNTLTTKGYVLSEIASATGAVSLPSVYAIWTYQKLATNPVISGSPISGINNWRTFGIPDESSTSGPALITDWFNFAGAGKIEYINAEPGLYSVSISDGWWDTVVYKYPSHTYRTQTRICRVRGGVAKVFAANINQNDTSDGDRNSRVGSSCACVIPLEQGDILYLASEHGEYGSAHIARIR